MITKIDDDSVSNSVSNSVYFSIRKTVYASLDISIWRSVGISIEDSGFNSIIVSLLGQIENEVENLE